MDVDWCLSCGRRVDGSAPYCSRECYSFDHPTANRDDIIDDDQLYVSARPRSQWLSKDTAAIIAWANQIPSGDPAGAPCHNYSPSSVTLMALRPPKLLLSHQRPIPPTLCMSTPLPARPHPSLPIVTPQQHIASIPCHSTEVAGTSRTSLLSVVTDSSFTTPPVKHPGRILKPTVFGALATQVRSWVSPFPIPPPPPHKLSPPRPHLEQPFSPSPAAPTFKRVESTTFTVLAKTHRSAALRIMSPSHSSTDEISDDDISGEWWLSSISPPDAARQAELQPATGKKGLVEPVRGRRVTLAPPGVDEHPAFWSRGRKLSRAVA